MAPVKEWLDAYVARLQEEERKEQKKEQNTQRKDDLKRTKAAVRVIRKSRDGGACPFCAKVLDTVGGLKIHIKTKHPKKRESMGAGLNSL